MADGSECRIVQIKNGCMALLFYLCFVPVDYGVMNGRDFASNCNTILRSPTCCTETTRFEYSLTCQ